MSMRNDPIDIACRNLVIDVPGRVDGSPLSFTIRAGELWGILGPNGAGKTTLLHTLAGLRAPRQGEVMLDGTALANLRRRDIARQLAVVFQERQLDFPSTVLESVMIGRHPFMRPWDIDTADDLALARTALQDMELDDLESRLVGSLSGGERQRLAIATALCQQPRVWLADEPGNHLDLHHQVKVMDMLAQQAKAGCTVAVCLHDINLAAQYCDRILLLYPDGNACWGDRDQMLLTEVLASLYRQPLELIEQNGHKVFIPQRHQNEVC